MDHRCCWYPQPASNITVLGSRMLAKNHASYFPLNVPEPICFITLSHQHIHTELCRTINPVRFSEICRGISSSSPVYA